MKNHCWNCRRAIRRLRPAGPIIFALLLSAQASDLDTIGFTDLVSRYGASLVTGSGVTVWQTEAPIANTTPSPYAPAPGSLTAWGVTMDFGGVPHATSSHADQVGGVLFNGMAPGITTAVGTDANDFVALHGLAGGFGTQAPGYNITGTYTTAPKPQLINASWIGTTGTATDDAILLRRADGLVSEQKMTMVVGVNNTATTPLNNPVLSQSYNSIAVGLSSHLSNFGLSTIDGTGRSVIDLVAPAGATSIATPLVSAAATLLIDKAQSTPSLNDATAPAMIRSLLQTTAVKLSGWAHTITQPLDIAQGAGELRINRAYDLLLVGEVNPGVVAQPAGWSLNTVGSGGTTHYTFFHPGGAFTSTLNWDRTIASYNADDTVTPNPVNNLDLRIFISDALGTPGSLVLQDASLSTIDNVEQLYESNLPAGNYTIEVQGLPGAAYALSFTAIPESGFPALAGLLAAGWFWRGRSRKSV